MGKKKPTIGYWYKVLYHLGICRGPVDALLEFRGGDKVAWKGVQTASGILAIDALNLWGGEKKEGGIQGDLHVMMGDADQTPNSMLAAELGPEQSAYRGRTTMAFTGRYGAFNPYPKAPWFKLRRVLKGWDDDTCWYPEKAGIPMASINGVVANAFTEDFSGGLGGYEVTSGDIEAFSVVPSTYGAAIRLDYTSSFNIIKKDLPATLTVSGVRFKFRMVERPTGSMDAGVMAFDSYGGPGIDPFRGPAPENGKPLVTFLGQSGAFGEILDENVWYAFDASVDLDTNMTTTTIRVASTNALVHTETSAGGTDTMSRLVFHMDDPGAVTEYAQIQVDGSGGSDVMGFNPAHILYDSITSADMKGEPVELINEASFEAAADLFYEEGFGLCTQYDASSESVEQFQQRILNVVGATLSQSREDGMYYLTPIRGVHDLGALPILADDDILEYAEEPSDPLESVNQVAVEWFDQTIRAKKTTTPLQALGAIQAVGAILADTSQYPEIPTESLALRVGARDLNEKSQPRKRFTLTTTRVAYAWRAGQFFRLQAPRRGIADMICMVGEIGAGVRRSGSIRLRAIQDVSSMPDTTYVTAEPGIDTTPSSTPTQPPAEAAFEAPYFELAGNIPTAELAALAADSGFIAAFAARPAAGVNFDLWTKTGAEEFEDRGDGDWCPIATIVEAGTEAETDFTFIDGQDLDEVLVGQAGLWGGEIVRVDAIDIDAGTISLARGCGDTPPRKHAASQRVLFFDGVTSTDEREYSDGETVDIKILSRTSSALYPIASAFTLSVTMDSRAARPYPPGLLRVTDDVNTGMVYPTDAVGELQVTWAHRDRLLQEDQVVDEAAASIGPEAGTTYTVTYYLDDVLEDEETGISGTSSTPITLSAAGEVRVEVKAVRDGLESWMPAMATFNYLLTASPIRVTDSADNRVTDSGDRRITE